MKMFLLLCYEVMAFSILFNQINGGQTIVGCISICCSNFYFYKVFIAIQFVQNNAPTAC